MTPMAGVLPSSDVNDQRQQATMKPSDSGAVFMVASGSYRNGLPEPTTFVSSQAESLREAGWDVFLSVVDDRTSLQGIRRNIQRMRTELARSRAFVVHAQYGSVTAAVARSIRGSLPMVLSFCGDDLLGTPNPGIGWRVREKCARWIGLWAAREASAIIVKSNNLLQSLPADLRVRATILPNGVDTSWFKPIDKHECRSILRWRNDGNYVLFNASCNEDQYRKNPSLAHEAVRLLASSFPGATLEPISKANPEEVRLKMNAADCLLVTSLQEGSPNIVKEAMACNLPVVSVPCGDVEERLVNTVPGRVCPYEAQALAESIAEVFRAARRSNGRSQLLLQGLTTARVAERLALIYRSVLKREQC